jgi:hypothetical protein
MYKHVGAIISVSVTREAHGVVRICNFRASHCPGHMNYVLVGIFVIELLTEYDVVSSSWFWLPELLNVKIGHAHKGQKP